MMQTYRSICSIQVGYVQLVAETLLEKLQNQVLVVKAKSVVYICLTMDTTLLTWIGNAVYHALKLVMQPLLRDITICGTDLRRLC